MTQHPLVEQLFKARVLPVVRSDSAAHATTAVHWLRDAGIGVFEIAATIRNAPSLIRELLALDLGMGQISGKWCLTPMSKS